MDFGCIIGKRSLRLFLSKKWGGSNESNFSGVGTVPVRKRKPAARERAAV
jgi:hypothetical protein